MNWKRVPFAIIAAAHRTALGYRAGLRQVSCIRIQEESGQEFVREDDVLDILRERKVKAFSLTSETLEGLIPDDGKTPTIDIRRRLWHWEFRVRSLGHDTDPKLVLAAHVLESRTIPAPAPESTPVDVPEPHALPVDPPASTGSTP